MRTLRLTIAYDGTRYAGWQAQPKAPKPTVQGTLQRVLARIIREPVRVVASGRTDAGVHALAQVAHVRTRSSVACERLLRSLNHLLPRDIAVLQVEEASPTFHARFDARRKRYRYRLCTAAVVSPFVRPYVVHVRSPLNVSRMRREAKTLLGRHSFRAFARASRWRDGVRHVITAIEVRRRREEVHIEVEGTGFAHTMMRSIVGTLLDVGRGRRPLGTIRRMLTTGDRRLAGATAPAKGLVLIGVLYGGGSS